MPEVWVCPLARLEATLHRSGAGATVSLLAPDAPLPPALSTGRHLRLDLSDIAEPLAGHVLAGTEQVQALLRFAADWDRREPLLVHCYAGVSRSTAAAFSIACALQPELAEPEIAAALRIASRSATPNARIVALADEILGREGRMTDAVQAIGRGSDCFEGNVFAMPIPPLP